MDKSGPRHSALSDPIIDRPDLQSAHQRGLYGGLTLGCWLLWTYLWLPTFGLLSSAIEIEGAEREILVYAAFDSLIGLLAVYHLPVLLSMSLLAWAAYNTVRFGGVVTRVAVAPVTAEAVARHFGTEPAAILRWQASRRLYVSHDADGCVAAVDTADPQIEVPA